MQRDLTIAGIRLVLRVRHVAVAEATAGILAEYVTPSVRVVASDPVEARPPSVVDELSKWASRWQMGAISDAEYQQQKAALLERPR